MEHQLRLLWQVQLLEQKSTLLEKQKSKVSMQEAHDLWEEIKTITQKISLEKENLQHLKKVCDKQELDLSDITVKYCQLEERLYSGEIKNLKEIEQVKAKYDAAKHDVAKQEQDYFNNVDDSDELSKKIIVTEKLLQEKKNEHAQKQQKISSEISHMDAEISLIKNQYNDLLKEVDKKFLEKYKVLKQNMSFPIAEIKNGICGGCRMSLPEAQIAFQGGKIKYCDNCGRILITIND